jgi:hypothetical protein
MNKIICIVPSVLMFACVGQGGFSVGGPSAGQSGPASATSATAGEGPIAGGGETKDFDPDAFYTITTTIKGQELALTFISPPDLERGDPLTNNASRSKVELRPLTKAPAQLWQFNPAGIDRKPSYTIWTKVSDFKESLTGILWISRTDNRFVPTPEYRAKHNRLTVGPNTPETHAFWFVVRSGSGFQIRSLYGHASEINQPTERERADKWNEERVLDVMEDGTLVHMKLAEAHTQWKMTKVGY